MWAGLKSLTSCPLAEALEFLSLGLNWVDDTCKVLEMSFSTPSLAYLCDARCILTPAVPYQDVALLGLYLLLNPKKRP